MTKLDKFSTRKLYAELYDRLFDAVEELSVSTKDLRMAGYHELAYAIETRDCVPAW